MCVKKSGSGFKYGSKGKVYKTKAGANRQARAAHANKGGARKSGKQKRT